MSQVNDRKAVDKLARIGKRVENDVPKSRFGKEKGGPVDLTACDPSLYYQAVVAVCRSGGAIMFGLTQDGGALCLTIYDEGDRTKDYAHNADELDQMLGAIALEFGERP